MDGLIGTYFHNGTIYGASGYTVNPIKLETG